MGVLLSYIFHPRCRESRSGASTSSDRFFTKNAGRLVAQARYEMRGPLFTVEHALRIDGKRSRRGGAEASGGAAIEHFPPAYGRKQVRCKHKL